MMMAVIMKIRIVLMIIMVLNRSGQEEVTIDHVCKIYNVRGDFLLVLVKEHLWTVDLPAFSHLGKVFQQSLKL